MKTLLLKPVALIGAACLILSLTTFTLLPATAGASFIATQFEEPARPDAVRVAEPRKRGGDEPDQASLSSDDRADPGVSAQDVQTVTHVIGSHAGLLLRPVSFLHRLSFMVIHTGFDALRWTWRIGLKNRPIVPLSDGPGMDLGEWEEELNRITGRPASIGTMRYLIDGREFFPRFVEALEQAEESVDIRTYIFDNDDYAMMIARLLRKRSSEIDIRVLLDGLGTILATKADPDTMPSQHVAPASMRVFLTNGSRVRVRQTTNPLFMFDHSKTTIVDHRLAFIGGMNIGREYRYDWHDMMVELQGPIVNILEKEFDKTWAHTGMWGDLGKLVHSLKPARSGAEVEGIPLRALFTRAADSQIYNSQLAAIRRARSYIYIQNAYFSDDAILYELIKARRRGVDVRVILTIEGNWSTMNASNILAVNDMLENGIRVFLYPGMSHIKAAVYDGWACLGSANFDKASLRFNGEINVATSHRATVDELIDRLFVPDFAVAVELTEPLPENSSLLLAELLADLL